MMRRWLVVLVTLAACGFSGRRFPGNDPDAAAGDGVLPAQCPLGYAATVTAGVYRIVETPATWNAARADCRDDGAATHLVVLSNDDERAAVRLLVPTGDVWLGISDRVNTSVWRWVTNEDTHGYPPSTVGMKPWKAGKPDNGDGGDQDCVEMQPAGDWDDKRCDTDTNAYVCECDAYAEDPAQSDPQS